jgi:hypothetical protein
LDGDITANTGVGVFPLLRGINNHIPPPWQTATIKVLVRIAHLQWQAELLKL